METLAIAIAILSLILAGLALGWQIAAWALDGPRIRTTLQQGILGPGGAAVATVGRTGKLRDMSVMREQGWNGPDVVAIVVTNHGRLRARITRFGVQLQRGGLSAQYPSGNDWSPDLPYWLEPGESATWYADMNDALALVNTAHESLGANHRRVFMTIETGTGKTVRTPQSLKLR